jgi:hypothetical protein
VRCNNEDLKAVPRLAGFNRTYLSKPERVASYPGVEIIAKLATEREVKRAEFFIKIHLALLGGGRQRLIIG